MMESRKGVIFDFYNTLVSDDILPPPVWRHLNDLGYRCSPELQRIFEPDAFDGSATSSSTGVGDHENWNRESWRKLLRFSGVPEDVLERILQMVLDTQDNFTCKRVPKAGKLIQLLKRNGYRIGLCSNWESPIEPCLESNGIAIESFDAITISATIGARKPHELMFHSVCRVLDISPSEAIFIGDNWVVDIGGALRAGLAAIWIRHGQPSNGLHHIVPEFDSLAELYSCMRKAMSVKAQS